MNTFHKSQHGFASMLFDAHETPEHIEKSLSVELEHYSTEEKLARLSIYKNNVYHSLTLTLKELYPSLIKILGEDFFNAMAKVFIPVNLPEQPNLTFFGKNIPEFIAEFEHTQQFLYLPDLARLEFYRHCAYYAEDQSHISTSEASKIDIEFLCQAKIEFVSSLKIIDSNYSIFSLWQQLEENGLSGEKSLNIDKPEAVLIYRDSLENNLEVNTLILEKALTVFLNLLQNKHSIGFALEKTASENPNFDASGAIAFIFSHSLVHRFEDK